VLLTGTFMVALDFFIVNVALPSMQHSLGAGASSVEWVVAGYALTSAVFLLAASRLADRIGRRRVFATGLALFTLSSAACGEAGSALVLVLGRLAQGTGAAMVMPSALAIIGVQYRGERLPRALAAYGLVMGLGAALGQLVGGLLLQLDPAGLQWRSCFLINVPAGLAALGALRLVPESRGASAASLDLPALALATLGLTTVVLPLVEGRQHGWPPWTWASFASVPLIVLALRAQQRRRAAGGGTPLLAPALLRSRTLRTGLATQLAFWCGQASFFLVLALYLQDGRGMSALQSGLLFTVMAVVYVAASARGAELAQRYGRRLLPAGALTLACGHGLLLAAVAGVGVGGSVLALVPGLALEGLGMGLLIVPLTTVVMAGVASEHAGAASGLMATVQSVGNALGVAVIGVVFFDSLHGGFAHAFELSLAALVLLLLSVAALARLVPEIPGRATTAAQLD
jgi:EmrB/QacA subfamily drug resistance transporter